MIVDDSGPHCFAPELAVQRFQEQEDILFTEGGALTAPHHSTLASTAPTGKVEDSKPVPRDEGTHKPPI